MPENNLKQKTISAMLWSVVGKFGGMTIKFISNIVLARILMPSDFGCIGMLSIFIAISDILIVAGFGSALVQKKNPSHLDYNSVFLWNLAMSIIMYITLFFSAPVIARFYEMPLIRDVLRVNSLTLIINSFAIVQNNQLMKQLKFKQLSIRNVLASAIGTMVAITLAFMGYGVWSLVISTLISSFASVLFLWKMSSWRPTLDFSINSLKELFGFGGMMALSSFVDTIYKNIQGLIIGKWYSAADMGYYSQAKRLEEIPVQSLSQIVSQVSFPVFASMQDNKEKLLYGVRKNISSLAYVNFPLCVLLMVVAEPLILLLFGDKWLVSVPYFQILCVGGMMYTINTMNNSIVKALGKSKIFFFARLTERVTGIVLIVIGASFGVKGLLWAVTLNAYITYFVIAFINYRLVNYGYLAQINDFGVPFIFSILSGIIVYFFGRFICFHFTVALLLQVTLYLVLYVGVSYVFKVEGFFTYTQIIKELLIRKRNNHERNKV